MPILASSTYPNAYGKASIVATRPLPLDSMERVSDAYVVKYNSSGQSVWAARVASVGSDVGNAITTDSGGNVYVTGQGQDGTVEALTAYNADGSEFLTKFRSLGSSEAFIVKYNTSGVVQWLARVSSQVADIGLAIATDSSGNVYVTGRCGFTSGVVTAFSANGVAFPTTFTSSGNNDVFIAKYNTNGVVQWMAKVGSTADDIGYAIATDSSGNVYVTGQGGQSAVVTAFNADGTAFATTAANSGSRDAFIVKYNTDGAVQWLARVASTGIDLGFAIATDSSGNVYVSGQAGANGVVVTAFNAGGTAFPTTFTASGSSDAFIVKYDTNGVVQWLTRVASTGVDVGNSIATDPSGNVYVTGQSGTNAVVTAFSAGGTAFPTTFTSSGTSDAFVVKYNTNGVVQWLTRVASTGNDRGNIIRTDSSGDVYVSGSGGANVTGLLTAFNVGGTEFAPTLAGTEFGNSFIVKYDTNGIVQWLRRVAGSSTIDSNSNIYTTGQFTGMRFSVYQGRSIVYSATTLGQADAYIVKYNTNGAPQWLARVAGTNSDQGFGTAVDSSRNVYVTGRISGTGTATAFNANGTAFATTISDSGTGVAFIVKYNTDGFVQWVAKVGSAQVDEGYGIATDSNDNVYVTGRGGSGVVVTAFNANGTAFATTIANSGFSDAFIVKYNTSGVVQWLARIGSAGDEIGYDIATDSSGNVFITGNAQAATAFNASGTAFATTLANSGSTDVFLAKYNTDGVVQWLARVATNNTDEGFAIATDPSGNVYITGSVGVTSATLPFTVFSADGSTFSTTNTSGSDAFVVKYNTNGVAQWVARVASGGIDVGRGIATDSGGNVYVTGEGGGSSAGVSVFNASGPQSFPATPTTTTTSGFVVKFNTDGFAQWISTIESTSTDTSRAIATGPNDDVYIATGTVDNSFTVTNYDRSVFVSGTHPLPHGLVVKYGPGGSGKWLQLLGGIDRSTGICVDSLGSAYVTGVSSTTDPIRVYTDDTLPYLFINRSRGIDAFLVKYSSTTTPQWIARVSSTGNDIAYGVATDASGNVYVTGQGGNGVAVTAFNADGTAFANTITNSGNTDAFIVKYNTSGVVQWATRVASTSLDVGYAIATDSGGNVYVTGRVGFGSLVVTAFNANGSAFSTTFTMSGGDGDAFVVKYDTNGLVQWLARVGSSGSDLGYGIATDSGGNVYVAGGGGADVVTAFNASGTAFATTLANSGLGDAFIVKYNTSGAVQWLAKVASTAADIGYAIATDPSGNVYVTGQTGAGVTTTAFNASGTSFATTLASGGNTDAFIVKYNTNGAVQWVAKVQTNVLDIGNGIATDSSGNVYVLGQCATNSTGSIFAIAFNANRTEFSPGLINLGLGDAFIVKYNTSGVVQWITRVASTQADIGYAITTDSGGNVYVTGQGGPAAVVTAYNVGGTIFGSSGSSVTGQLTTTFVVKYNTSGVVQWISSMGGGSGASGRGISLDPTGNIYVAGDFSATSFVLHDAV